MKKTHIALLCLVLMSLAAACGKSPILNHETAQSERFVMDTNHETLSPCPLEFPRAGLCASLTWDEEPSGDAENSGTLRFWSKRSSGPNGPYVEVTGDVAVQLWMPDMGHGSSPVRVVRQGAGVYSASRVYFIMPGKWDVRVQIKRNGKVDEQAVLRITI